MSSMHRLVRICRSSLFLIAVLLFATRFQAASLSATSMLLDYCDTVCTTDSDCDQECLYNYDDLTTCGGWNVCYSPGYCGDGFCAEADGETADNCAQDCFIGPGDSTADAPTCGNSICEEGESKRSCPADCSYNQDICGDGLCVGNENEGTCPDDCTYTDYCNTQSDCGEDFGWGYFCHAHRCTYEGMAETCLASNNGLDCSDPNAKCAQVTNGYGYCIPVF